MSANHSLPRFIALAGILTAGLCASALPNLLRAQDAPKADNTKVNKQDRTPGAVTADQQKNNLTDRQLTQQIRKAVVADKTLSTYAHNVKIVAQNGAVTLKGPVRSEDEKKTIVAKAGEIAGAGKITDELSIAPPK
jgi:osmotically-inducible protein OsmY